MSQAVELIPLLCIRCQFPIAAQPDEVAWVCSQCQQGQQLSDDGSLQPLEVHYAAGISAAAKGKPYWVAQGRVQITRRQTYRGDQSGDMNDFWVAPRLFFVPAFTLPLEQLVQIGTQLLRQPPSLQPGSPAAFLSVNFLPADMRPLAEYIILAVEAERKDDLRHLEFDLQLDPPQLWVLP